MKKTTSNLFFLPYLLWIFLFVLAPVVMIIWKSFFNIEGQFTLENYQTYFTSQNWTYLKMSLNSVLYAGIITVVTLLISYPTAFFLTQLKHKQLWLMLIVLPTWINLLLKAYAFIGIFDFYRSRTAADSLYGLFIYLCSQLHRAAFYDSAHFQRSG